MAVLLGWSGGILQLDQHVVRTDCPLQRADYLAVHGHQLAALDNQAHLLWLGQRVYPADSGIEALCLLPWGCLTLSGDTDCLTLHDLATGQRMLTAPAGVFPQDLCLIPGTDLLAVCGGADGTVRLMTRRDLETVHISRVPGNAQRLDASRGWLHVLCLTEDDGLKSLLCRIPLLGDRCEPLCSLPGIPGAVCADGRDGVWVAVSEQLCHFPADAHEPDLTLTPFGLIRHIVCRDGLLLLTDPILEQCILLLPNGERTLLWEGDVGQALWV